MLSRLQYISQGETAADQLRNISEALDAGCDWIQLRFKNAKAASLLPVAEQVKKQCEKYKAVLIINDHVNIAKQVNADGVHLGLTDTPVTEAKKILGKKIIGGTANTFADVVKRINEKADYIGLGPFRFTKTKEKLSPVLGYEGYRAVMDALQEHFPEQQTAIIAIGGITSNDVAGLISSGIYGVALSGSITAAANKKMYVDELKSLLYGKAQNS